MPPMLSCSNAMQAAFVSYPGDNASLTERDHPSCCLQSLSGVHQAGLLHLDIKTANLLLDWDLGLLLSDLGLMRPMDADGTCDVKCGTPGFQAPEVVAGKKYGPAADW